MKSYKLWYTDETPFENEDSPEYNAPADDGWERWSLPVGNGYLGASIFGRKETERILITENSLCNPYARGKGGLNSFADIRLHFGHGDCADFTRYLDLNRAVSGVEYTHGGVRFTRSYFASYPDRVLVMRFEASEKAALSFELEVLLPYVKPYLYEPGDGMGKTGQVFSQDTDALLFGGEMEYYRIAYEGMLRVTAEGGETESRDGKILVRNADAATVILAVGTNYRMESSVFTQPDHEKKLADFPHPHEMVAGLLNRACQKPYHTLLADHLRDYSELFDRADVSLSETVCELPTDRMLDAYQNGVREPYLEELYFQYGRYLLIASSRPGTYPANLQGTWNKYDAAPWSSGYWHNINVQMNYWPAFVTGIPETFDAYARYFRAYLPLARTRADEYIKAVFPEKDEGEGNNGWIIGTGAWLYTISGAELPNRGHSGPGTGGLTAKLFWDCYDFTRDHDRLRTIGFPALEGMAKFLSKTLERVGDAFLVKYSASPEQKHNGSFVYTAGCAFDQQMVYETYKDYLQAAEILGIHDELTETIRGQIDRLEPVLIGESGQIKEYREERFYGDIGEKNHRHISHLIGLYPGTSISACNPGTLEAAKVSLDGRGDMATGWAIAHRLNAWARTKDGNRAYTLLRNQLSHCTYHNLWDTHPPFQIDGNFGGTAGMAEMLLQSHEGYIDVIPAIPDVWDKGCFRGLAARGNFTVNAWWESGTITRLEILSRAGEECRLRLPKSAKVLESGGNVVESETRDGILRFETGRDRRYIIEFAGGLA